MPFRPVEHTADLALEAEAATAETLFAEALRGLTDSITLLDRVGTGTTRRVALHAPALDSLLVDWLTEAIYLFEVENLLFRDAEVKLFEDSDGWRLEALLDGEPADPYRHPIKILLKAVTYHHLAVHPTPTGWRAHVIFDI